MFKKMRDSAVAATCLLAIAGPGLAQAEESQERQGPEFTLEEVLVTARKKVENQQSVPIAISALTTEQLDEKAITHLADVAKYVSGLNFEQGVLPNDTRPVIRGMSINRGRPNVAILVDGIDISSETLTVAGGGAFANLSLLDLQRVEVINGPQSVTYGRSAFAGAINYVTKRPDASAGAYGYFEAEANEHGYLKGYGNLSLPLIGDALALGATLLKSDFDGYYENPNTGGDLGGVDQKGAAIALNYAPDGRFSAYLRGEYAKESYAARPVVMRASVSNLSAPGDFALAGTVPGFGHNMPIPGGASRFPEVSEAACAAAIPFAHLYGQPLPCATMLAGDVGAAEEAEIDLSPNPLTGEDFAGTEVRNRRLTLELNWAADAMEILSLTGYTGNESRVQEDFDLTNFDLQSAGPGSANFDPMYAFANPFGNPPDFTPLGNAPGAAFTQFGVNTNSDTSFDYEQFSQEIRFTGEAGSLGWMADFLYWSETMDAVMNQMWWARESIDSTYWNAILSRFVDPTCATPGRADSCLFFTGIRERMAPNRIPMSRDTSHWSVAASFLYRFNEDLRATAEGRYLEETIDYESLPLDTFIHGFLNMPYFDPATNSFQPVPQQQKIKETEFVPRFSLDWQASDQAFVYASAGKGFKPGGIATTDGNGDISTGHYKPEQLWAYEIGLKTDLSDGRLRLNGALFYNDYTDQQVPYFVTNNLGVTNVSVTNAGKSEIFGIELEALYRPSANWSFTGGYTRADTEYKDFNISEVGNPSTYDKIQSGNALGDFKGKSFTNTPKHTLIFAMRYDGEFGEGVGYFAELFGNYQSKRYLDQGNLSYLPSVWLLDFSAGIRSDHWRITAYVNNLTDEDKVRSGLGNVSYGFMPAGQIPPFGASLTLPAPRTLGIRARFMF